MKWLRATWAWLTASEPPPTEEERAYTRDWRWIIAVMVALFLLFKLLGIGD